MTKITIAIIIGIIIVIGLGITLGVLLHQKSQIDVPVMKKDTGDIKKISANLKEYKSETLGVKFQYLEEFTRFGEELDSNICQTVSMYNPETTEGINLVVGDLEEETPLDAYIDIMATNISNASHIKKKDITVTKGAKIAGLDAIKYQYKSDETNIYQCLLSKDKKQYVLTYSKKGNEFDPSRGDFLFSTFAFLEQK